MEHIIKIMAFSVFDPFSTFFDIIYYLCETGFTIIAVPRYLLLVDMFRLRPLGVGLIVQYGVRNRASLDQ